MAQYVQSTMSNVPQMTLVASEEAAAGITYAQQQLPPQQHIVQMAYQPPSVIVIEPSSFIVQTSGTVEDNGNLKVAMTQPLQAVMQSQAVHQEVQHQVNQQLSNATQQVLPRTAAIRTYSPVHQLSLQYKQTNQRQVASPQVQLKRQPDQQILTQQVLTVPQQPQAVMQQAVQQQTVQQQTVQQQAVQQQTVQEAVVQQPEVQQPVVQQPVVQQPVVQQPEVQQPEVQQPVVQQPVVQQPVVQQPVVQQQVVQQQVVQQPVVQQQVVQQPVVQQQVVQQQVVQQQVVQQPVVQQQVVQQPVVQQQTMLQPVQTTSQQFQSSPRLQGSAATPRPKTIVSQPQQRQPSPQLVSPQNRPARPRLLRRLTNSPQSIPTPVVPNQQQVIRSPTPQLVQSVQKQTALQDVQMKQQNGTPESSSTVVVNSNVSEVPSLAESSSGVSKSQMTPKRNVSENRQLHSNQSAILINTPRQGVSPNQQRQIQVKQTPNKTINSAGTQSPTNFHQGNILQQTTQQPLLIQVVKTVNGQQQLRLVHTGSLAKQIAQKQQQPTLQLQSPQQQQVYRIVTQAPIQQQCVKAQQQVQQQVLQLQAAPQSGASIQVPLLQQVQVQPQIIRMQVPQQQGQQQMQLQLHGNPVQIHVSEQQLQGQQQVQLQVHPAAAQQLQFHVQQQAPQQLQLQVQQQAQQQLQFQVQQQAPQQVQLQVQQQAPQQVQLQVQQQAPQQVQLQVQQQAPQQVQSQVQQAAPQQLQLQVQQQVQKQTNQMQVQLQTQQQVRPQVLPRNVLVSPVQKVVRMQTSQSVNVDLAQGQSPRVHNMYSGPRAQHKNIQLITSQQQTQPPQMVVSQEQLISTLVEQVQKPLTTEENPQEPISQAEQVAVFEGVTVRDQFPTGVLQECVVSESGEIVIANDSSMLALDPIKNESGEDTKEDLCDSTVPQKNIETTLGGENEFTLKISHQDPTKKPEPVGRGFVAVCPHCGINSLNLSKCQRCNYNFPENVKIIPDHKPSKPLQASIAHNFTGMILKSQLVLPSEIEFALKLAGKNIARSLTPLVSPSASVEVKRKRCSASRKPRIKISEEPEILTLSSDDEEKQEKKPSVEMNVTANGTAPESETDPATMEEPDSYARKNSPGVEGGGMLEQAMDGSIAYPYVLILCRTLRIGSYKGKPVDRVVLSTTGLEMKVPLASGQNVVVSIPMSEIYQFTVSFSRSMPVLFINTYATSASKIRKALQMNESNKGYYFDPGSSDETLKRITLLPEKITEDFKITLKKIVEVSHKILIEISNGAANEILVKSSPCESALRSRPGIPGAEIQTIMIYPPPPSKGGISINTEDYACLGEDQFLNDVIIDFYLKYLMQSVLTETDRERTHVFSSFFYKRLTSRPKTKGRRHPIEDDPKLTPAEKRHARVKTWTKNVNLFSKDFIIIPINENCHWFLAIVCFPGQDGCLRMSDNTPIVIPKQTTSPNASAAAVAAAAAAATSAKLKVQNNVMSIGATTITPVKAPPAATITIDNGDEGSDRDEAEGDEEEMAETQSDDEDESNGAVQPKNGSKDDKAKSTNETLLANDSTAASAANKVKASLRDGVKQPCILIFDSLVGAPRYRVAATLREYLSIEYKVKQNKVKEFSKDTIKGMLPKVPQQTNFTDCGLYLLQYVEMFFKDPIRDYHPPIKQLINWFSEEIVTRKREFIVNLLHDLMKEQKIDPSSLPLPKLVFNYASLKAQQQAEDEDAQARLAAADAEAEAEIARKQMADLQGVPATTNNTSEEPMDQDEGCEKEETASSSAEPSVLVSSGGVVGSSDNHQANVVLKQPLVPYAESSDDSNESSVVKRTQSDESEDGVERKKRKAE